jgi:DNA (cytosine-5)-methyltransferase 1
MISIMPEEVKAIKVLNLYAGIGGNRKLWENVDVTAVEIEPKIAEIYRHFFPDDKVVIGDAHQFLLEHFEEFDFIWSSPPCPTHSRFKEWQIKINKQSPCYPDMKLYEEIIFLKFFSKSLWVIENVRSYYEPLIAPQEVQRHFFWSNFIIGGKEFEVDAVQYGNNQVRQKNIGFDLSSFKGIEKTKILRNCVKPELGLHIFNMAFRDRQHTLADSEAKK